MMLTCSSLFLGFKLISKLFPDLKPASLQSRMALLTFLGLHLTKSHRSQLFSTWNHEPVLYNINHHGTINHYFFFSENPDWHISGSHLSTPVDLVTTLHLESITPFWPGLPNLSAIESSTPTTPHSLTHWHLPFLTNFKSSPSYTHFLFSLPL